MLWRQGDQLSDDHNQDGSRQLLYFELSALLVLEAGVSIMFAETAGISVQSGTLQVLGTEESPVHLVSTNLRAGDYFQRAVDQTSKWGGLIFDSSAQDTQFSEDGDFLAGSTIRHCSLVNGGLTQSSALYMESSSILLQDVTIINAQGTGIYVDSPSSPLLHNGDAAWCDCQR